MSIPSASARLRKLLEKIDPTERELPLIHITDSYNFIDILSPKKLLPQKCDVFSENLTYLFYGRPSYRTKHKGNKFISANLPVVMIFHPGKLNEAIKRVFPFDTGAFSIGIYSDFFHKRSELEHFNLDPTVESARKIVAYFYRNNGEYFYGGTRKNVEIPPLHFEAEGIFELARTSAGAQADGTFKPDLRSSSIEIQVEEEIDIHNALLGLIIPQIFLDAKENQNAIADLSPKHLETYTGVHNIGSESLVGMIFDRVNRIYAQEGIL